MAGPQSKASFKVSEHAVGYARGRMSGKFSDIALSSLLTIVPISTLSVALLGLVFYYRVVQNPSALDNVGQTSDLDMENFYYVDISSTFLVFIASWSSSIAPALVGFAMTLASYPIAKEALRQSRTEPHAQGLTPYQLALTIGFLSGGGYGATWRWIKYVFSGKDKRTNQAKPLAHASSITLLMTLLG